MGRLIFVGTFLLWASLGCGGDSTTTDGEIQSSDGAPDQESSDMGSNDAAALASDGTMERPDSRDVDASIEPPIEWIDGSEFGPCQPSDSLGGDPLTSVATMDLVRTPSSPRIVHLLDIELDETGQTAYTVGAGGLFILGVEDQGFTVRSNTNVSGIRGSFDKVELLDDGLIAVSARNRGVKVLRFDNGERITEIASMDVEDASGMAWHAPYLSVASHAGRLDIFDLSNPETPTLVGAIDELGHPWELVAVGNRLYVADNSLGIVTIDISDPNSPRILSQVSAAGGAQDLHVQSGYLYAAVGSAGVETFRLTDPDLPHSMDVLDVGSAIVSVSGDAQTLWAVDQESVIAMDITDPEAPQSRGGQVTDQWAMHVAARGNRALIADWGQVISMELRTDTHGPDVDPSSREIYLVPGGGERRITLKNRGDRPLSITGLTVADSRIELAVEHRSIEPGEQGALRLVVTDDGQPMETEICIATNDGDEPILRIPVETHTDRTLAGVGEAAPDFVLRDVDGNMHQLSAQRGHPVVLIYFATW